MTDYTQQENIDAAVEAQATAISRLRALYGNEERQWREDLLSPEALEALLKANEWQPMETIPTGVDVLLVDKWGGRGIGEMDSDGTLRVYGIGEVAPWNERGWLPLPQPPSATAAKEES